MTGIKRKQIIAGAVILCIAAVIGSPSGPITVQSPEETKRGPPPPPGCVQDSQCPVPAPRTDQNAACLAPRCITATGQCDPNGRILAGKTIPNMLLPSASECLLNPVICSASGAAVADSNKTIAEADGTECSSPSGGRRVCNKPICSGGSCVNVADPALKDGKCGESQDEGCITKTPL